MTDFRSEDMLVAIVALGVIPWIAWTVHRGLAAGRLPLLRSHIARNDRPRAFAVLLLFYVAAALAMAFIAFDLLDGARAAR